MLNSKIKGIKLLLLRLENKEGLKQVVSNYQSVAKSDKRKEENMILQTSSYQGTFIMNFYTFNNLISLYKEGGVPFL